MVYTRNTSACSSRGASGAEPSAVPAPDTADSQGNLPKQAVEATYRVMSSDLEEKLVSKIESIARNVRETSNLFNMRLGGPPMISTKCSSAWKLSKCIMGRPSPTRSPSSGKISMRPWSLGAHYLNIRTYISYVLVTVFAGLKDPNL